MAHYSAAIFRVVFYRGDTVIRVDGPYASVGAARGKATAVTNQSDLTARVQKAEPVWMDVSEG